MFSGLRLRLTSLYALAALILVALVGVGAYLIVARYFWNVTDLALQHKMAHEFNALGAPLPPELAPADRDWSVVRGELDLLPMPRWNESRDGEQSEGEYHADDSDDNDDTPVAAPSVADVDAAELAAIAVLPLDGAGNLLFNPNANAYQLTPDLEALRVALAVGSDLRTTTTPAGNRVRLLTYRLTRSDGPAALQVGRELSDQEQVLAQLTSGLLVLGALSMLLVGAASWWLAGRALQPAQSAWERQQQFIASASHELRTPLTLIRASAEVALRETAPDAAEQQTLIQDIVSETDHMRRLVDDLLLLSRLDSGQLSLTVVPVELAPLLGDMQRQVARVGLNQGVAIELGAVAGTIPVDVERLRQVLLIVLDNALRHTPAGGRIGLAATPQGREVQIRVTDTGSGIAPEHLAHVFERFYRADSARGRESGNAGLGLSIAKGLVTAMGGRIVIDSAVGVGTTVQIIFPCCPTT